MPSSSWSLDKQASSPAGRGWFGLIHHCYFELIKLSTQCFYHLFVDANKVLLDDCSFKNTVLLAILFLPYPTW